MARIAADRSTHLTREEIAREALRQFDAYAKEPSIRSLAAALRVAPTAIYYHFPSQAAICQAVVELVWEEAAAHLLELVPKPFEADPAEVLVAMGIVTRRAYVEHFSVARFMTATPAARPFMENTFALVGHLLGRRGLEGEEAAEAFHHYASYMLGATLFAASRKEMDNRLASKRRDETVVQSRAGHKPSRRRFKRTGLTVHDVADLSVVDPKRDEELFVQGLRDLVERYAGSARS